MSLATQHFYRFKYLKSEHWANLRLRKLAIEDAKCKICKSRNVSNDVHHITYRNLFDVRLGDLVVLCRACHQTVHEVLVKFQTIKQAITSRAKWTRTVAHIRWIQRVKQMNQRIDNQPTAQFRRCRDVLVSLRLVKRPRMKWRDDLETVRHYLSNPIQFLSHYIRITGKDPRYRADRMGAQKLFGPINARS